MDFLIMLAFVLGFISASFLICVVFGFVYVYLSRKERF